jgi:hypothetical protein
VFLQLEPLLVHHLKRLHLKALLQVALLHLKALLHLELLLVLLVLLVLLAALPHREGHHLVLQENA